MPDQWDPKYPKDLPLWSDGYAMARGNIYDQSSPWHPAFAAVVQAEEAGEFADVKEFFRGTCDDWNCRLGLWDLYFKPMFEQDPKSWPLYVQAVHGAVPGDWLADIRRLNGIPTHWISDARRVWAFKSTVLFVAGLIEGELPPVAEPIPAGVDKLVNERVQSSLQPYATRMEGIDRLVEERTLRLLESRLRPIADKIDALERSPLPRL
jgi:hypothetical protein